MSEKCPTCGQQMNRIKVKPLPCAVCARPVPWTGKGRRPETHPECRGTWAKVREVKREETES